MPKQHRLATDGRLGEMRVFLEVVRHASFGRAATVLRLPQSSISRKIQRVERALDTRLFTRGSKGVALTEAGERWAEHCRRILTDVSDAEDAMRGLSVRASGHLRVAVPVSFGVRHLSAAMSDFLAEHPEVTTELVYDDRRNDLFRDGIDVAVRIGTLADSRLIARRIGVNRRRSLPRLDTFTSSGRPPIRPS